MFVKVFYIFVENKKNSYHLINSSDMKAQDPHARREKNASLSTIIGMTMTIYLVFILTPLHKIRQQIDAKRCKFFITI